MLWSKVILEGFFLNRDIMFEQGENATRGNIKEVHMEGDTVIFHMKWVYVSNGKTPWTPSMDADRFIMLKLDGGENRLHYPPQQEHVYGEFDEHEVPIFTITILEHDNKLSAPR